MNRELHREAAPAARGALYIALSQLTAVLIGLALAFVMPRLFGATDYGSWVIFRSVIALLTSLSLLGTPEVIARFYVARVAEGRRAEAARLFKSVAAIRAGATLILAVVGYGMLRSAEHGFAGAAPALWLALSVLLLGADAIFKLLLLGERRLRALAILGVLQTAVAPVAVTLAYAFGGLASVPPACVAGDALCLCASAAAARRHVRRAPGWLPRAEWKTVLAFGGAVAAAATAFNLLLNSIPYLMGLRGYSLEAIAFFGVASRVSGMALMMLATLGGSLFPALTAVMEHSGIERAIRWQDLILRAGLAALLMLLGILLIAGESGLPLILGATFAAVAPVMCLGVLAVVPLWVGLRAVLIALLAHRPGVYAGAAAALLGAFAAVFVALPPDADGRGAVLALFCGALGFMIWGLAAVRTRAPLTLGWRWFLWPLLTLAAARALGLRLDTFYPAAGVAAVWCALFVAGVLAFRLAHGYEIRDVLRSLKNGRSIENSPDGAG
jgi:O-antigen/teichoic acid export membrane protein